jgi:hypothetical protein
MAFSVPRFKSGRCPGKLAEGADKTNSDQLPVPPVLAILSAAMAGWLCIVLVVCWLLL